MKYRLLDMVVCPHCQGRLICAAFSMVAREVLEGVLTCGCGRWYPIIGGVPRLLPDSLMADFLLDNIDFLEKHKGNIPKSLAPSDGEDEYINLKRRTSSSFGFEWGTFSEVIEEYEAIFLGHISPVEESFFRHKLVLDAGCGAGRYSYYAARFGAEVIAVDFSKAVEAAYRNNRHFSKVHVVQGDIYKLPLRKEFDYCFCIGVLHHLPEPEKGFEKLVGLLRPNSPISIWTYGRRHNLLALYIYEPIKRVSTRMPHKMLYYLCYLPASILELFNILYKVFKSFRLSRRFAGLIPFRHYSHFPFRTKLNDAFDVFSAPSAKYYTEQEIRDWFEAAGLKDIDVQYRKLDGVEKGIKGFGINS